MTLPKSLLNVTIMSLSEAGISSCSFSSSAAASFFIPRFLRSDAMRFLSAALGNCFGNMHMTNANANNETPSTSHPSHQAPNQRGSKLSIVGVRSGEMLNLRQNDASAYPPAGPNSRKKYDKLTNAGVFDFFTLSSR